MRPFAFLLFASLVASAGDVAIDPGAPIDPATGAIRETTDPTVVAATGARIARLNFILGPWNSPTDTTRYLGRTWFEAYDRIVDGYRSRGLSVYGLIGAESIGDPEDLFRDEASPDPAAARNWIARYAANAVSIVDHFKDRVRVFETYNEPNDWAGGDRSKLHPRWFAEILQEVYLQVKAFNGHDADPTWQVTLVSGPLFTFDLTDGAGYLADTYWYGRNVLAWDWTRERTGSFPLDGIGLHLYVAQSAPADAEAIRSALLANIDGLWSTVAAQEGGGTRKRIWVSECGWPDWEGEAFQAEALAAGVPVLRDDPRVAMAMYFCLQDFPAGPWGLYRSTGLSASDRKPAYEAFQRVAASERVVVGFGASGGARWEEFSTSRVSLAPRRLPWNAYASAVGEVRPAAGDFDGDGRDELVVGLAAYPPSGGWLALFDDPASGGALVRWARVPWSACNAAGGETWPSCGDLDGDGVDELVVGLGRYTALGGRVAVLRGGTLWKWLRVPWSAYDAANGETRPSCGDLDGDGRDEVVVGLGRHATGGYLCVFESPETSSAARWLRVPWSAYNGAEGSTRPACGDYDGDGRDELAVGLGPYSTAGGYGLAFDDASVEYRSLGWWRVNLSAYASENGETRPARGPRRAGAETLLVGLGPSTSGEGRVQQRSGSAGGFVPLAWIQSSDAAARNGTWPAFIGAAR